MDWINEILYEIDTEIGAFSFVLALVYMIAVSGIKLIFDKGAKGYTRKLSNMTLSVFVIAIGLYVLIFNESYWIVGKAIVALSCIRFWYEIGFHYVEKIYYFIMDVVWEGIKAFFNLIKTFFDLFDGNLYGDK